MQVSQHIRLNEYEFGLQYFTGFKLFSIIKLSVAEHDKYDVNAISFPMSLGITIDASPKIHDPDVTLESAMHCPLKHDFIQTNKVLTFSLSHTQYSNPKLTSTFPAAHGVLSSAGENVVQQIPDC